MNVRSLVDHVVTIPALDLAVGFPEGESLGTEISTKFRRVRLRAELAAGGLELGRWWPDADDGYAVCLARPRR